MGKMGGVIDGLRREELREERRDRGKGEGKVRHPLAFQRSGLRQCCDLLSL